MNEEALVENDKAMDAIVDACVPVTAKLIDTLKTMHPLQRSLRESKARPAISSMSHGIATTLRVLKATWSGVDITALMDQLEKLQSQLVLRMLYYLNIVVGHGNSQQAGQYECLKRSQSQIVEVLAVSEEKLEQIDQHLALNEKRARAREERIISAILTLTNGETQLLGSSRVTNYDDDHQRSRSVVTFRASQSATLLQTDVRDFSAIRNNVLDCLYFRQQMDRYETVNSAHQDTYEWVVSDSGPSDATWAPLVDWLEQGGGCYWISGKAGSGKSTLMKHIFHHKRTHSALNTWAGEAQLGIAHFFFWHLGSGLQRSQNGLLQSLLHDILSQRPYLISLVMPELLPTVSTLDGHAHFAPPSHAELLRWFRALVKHATPMFRLVFFIDGIDEYDGVHQDLIDLIQTAILNANVKFLVSSRPIPVCVDAFSSYPGLRLHELTRTDIKCYVKDHMAEGLSKQGLPQWWELIEEIVDKSWVVFLWVVLVCRSLRDGLQNFDNVAELRRRLDELPSDLHELYLHILGKVPVRYRPQTSELFQIVLLANETQAARVRLSTIQLHFAVQDKGACPTKPIRTPSEQQDLKDIEQQMVGRIRSRSMGLLETSRGFGAPKQAITFVDFIHKTAVEFLRTPEIWSDITSYQSDVNFSPAVSLYWSCLQMCNAKAPDTIANLYGRLFKNSLAWGMLKYLLDYASIAENTSSPVPRRYHHEMEKVMDAYWEATEQLTTGSRLFSGFHDWSREYLTDNGMEWPVHSGYSGRDLAMVYSGIASYFTSTSTTAKDPTKPKQPAGLLQLAVTRFLHPQNYLGELSSMELRWIRICAFLLQSGANPNEPFEGNTAISPWHHLLGRAVQYSRNKTSFHASFLQSTSSVRNFTRLFVTFITHGADVNATVTHAAGRKTLSVLDIVHILFPEADSRQEDGLSDDDLFGNPLGLGGSPQAGSGNSAEITKFRYHLLSLLAAKDIC